ncbi:MAG: hypothetical protein AAB513_00280 [Patescibacteria group bacterium]
MKEKKVLVVFGEQLPPKWLQLRHQYDVVITSEKLRQNVEKLGFKWTDIDGLIEPGSIYEASTFAEELSHLKFSDGSRIAKSFLYKGYELWWTHYDMLFLYFCLPYTRYRKLLEYVRSFQGVYFYRPPNKSLFSCYLEAYGSKMIVLQEPRLKSPSFLPFGVFLQIVITLLCLPILILRRYHSMIFIGDKFEKDKDYDSRVKFIYEELRQKKIPFVEFIRGLESWKTVLEHAFTRKRPVVYSEAVAFVGRFISILTGGHSIARKRFGSHIFSSETDREARFKFFVATQYLLGAYDDIWAIRIMKWILRVIGVRAAFISAACERNFHTVLGCKLNVIPIVGILHGFASKNYNVYDFMPGFDGEKSLSVDKYGLWSEWWRGYYIKNSKTYRPEQLFVSGPMRPLQKPLIDSVLKTLVKRQKINVLLVSEIVAVPSEVMPYLDALFEDSNFSVYIKFRQNKDAFEEWLKINRPDVLAKLGKDRTLKGTMNEAIELCDVVVGSQSTGVIEATLHGKPFVFFNTKKWGDYFDLKSLDSKYNFFAENPKELVNYIRESEKIPKEVLKDFCERFFGDPRKNGSKWAVEELEKFSK